jgi:pyridoxal phosphate enzyme (YggS family)
MTDLADSIRERYLDTLDQIALAAQRVNRNPSEIRLVVVTKTQPLDIIEAALAAGIKIFGENYPEEGVIKIQSVPKQSGVEWHMIGHVQSRKARLVAEHFALLHSLDSVKLAQRLAMFAAEQNRILPVLLEFNVGGEASKSGWNVLDDSQLAHTLPEIESILDLPNVRVCGLMTMPPLGIEPEASRRFFQRLRLIRDQLALRYPQADWHELSMGTSADYTVAVEEGATLVRVGTAIVGARDARKYKSEAEREV